MFKLQAIKIAHKILGVIGITCFRKKKIQLLSSDWIEEYVKKNGDFKIIFDIGAHHGNNINSYRDLFPEALIYGFEPSKNNFKKLSKLKSKNINIYNIGLSDNCKDIIFNKTKSSACNSLLEPSDNASKVWGGIDAVDQIGTEICNFTTLDKFCADRSIDFIDFIKIDVQGAEYRVLNGARQLLLSKKIKLVQFEVILGDTYKGQKTLDYYIHYMNSCDYRLASVIDQVSNKDGMLIQVDLMFSI
jgi:FkbM family methyltransferase